MRDALTLPQRSNAVRLRRLAFMLLFGIVTICVIAVVSLLFLFGGGEHSPAFRSPDGRFEASADAVGGSALDMGSVTIEIGCLRECKEPSTTQAYSGPGFYYPSREGRPEAIDPAIQWIDGTHLRIRYDRSESKTVRCGTAPFPVVLICEPSPAAIPLNSSSKAPL